MKRALVFCIALACALPALAQDRARQLREIERAVGVGTNVQSDSVTVGERFEIRYRAVFPDSLTLLPTESFELGNCRMVSLDWSDNQRENQRVRKGRLVVMTLDLEEAHVPAAAFNFLTPAGDTVTAYSEDVYVPVRRVVAAEQPIPRPLKPQWEAPRSFTAWFIAGAVLLALLAALWWWRRRPKPAVDAPAVPQLPADVVALQALDEIERKALLAAGEFKRFYSEVTDVLRTYLENRYNFLAMEETTDEILAELDRRNLRIDGVEDLLKEADLVKFAKHVPDAAAGTRAMESARDIVVRTAPRPLARPHADEQTAVGE